MVTTSVAYSLRSQTDIWANDDAPSPLEVFALNKNDIGDILSLQKSIEFSLQNSTDRVFLKQRSADDYAHIMDTGGLVLGIKKDNYLVAGACVNNAIDKGRVEIVIDKDLNPKQVAVFQGAMVHPDMKAMNYHLADVLYIKRMEWAMEQNKKQVFASACSSVYNPITSRYMDNPNNKSGDEKKNGNWRVINGLQKKGFGINATSIIFDRGLRLDITSLSYTLPETKEALYTHMSEVVHQDVAKQWIPKTKPSLKLV